MFGNVLVMLLFNTKEETYHPIMYFESPFPGGFDEERKVIRYKSKGHRTEGFKDKDEAIAMIQPEIVDVLPNATIIKELETPILWDGEGIPADNQLREVK